MPLFVNNDRSIEAIMGLLAFGDREHEPKTTLLRPQNVVVAVAFADSSHVTPPVAAQIQLGHSRDGGDGEAEEQGATAVPEADDRPPAPPRHPCDGGLRQQGGLPAETHVRGMGL